MGTFLTLDELYLRRGSQAAVEALLSGSEDVLRDTQTALENAESEARRELSKNYSGLPASPAETTPDLKALIATAFIIHARRLVAPLENHDDEWKVHQREVLSVYRDVDRRIDGLTLLKPSEGVSGVAVALPRRRLVTASAEFEALRDRAGRF